MLRRERPDLGVVLLAANEHAAAEAENAVPTLADDLLLKTRCREDLRLAVRRALEQCRLRAEIKDLRQSVESESQRRLRELSRNVRQVERAYRLALESLVAALDAREGEKRDLYHGALLHDLGKIGIPDSILLKPAPLTHEEWRVMKSHPRVGFAIVRDLPFLRAAADCVIGHHERWDGRGYPLGLSGEELPRAARIVAVADALDAMTVRRPYRDPLPFERVTNELVENRGTQFDPEIVDAALELFHDWEDLHPDAQAWRQVAESDESHARFDHRRAA